MDALLNLCSAFGLSGAAGLNAYIPLLTVAIMQNRGLLHLAAPYDLLGQWWCIAILAVLLVVEIVVDKVPGADHINDLIQTAVRPTAGAILFASQAGMIHGVHPGVWIAIGLLTSGGVHGVKAVSRPVINMTSMGLGAPIASTVEDLVSTVLAIVAILAPILAVVLLAVFGWLLWKLFHKFFSRQSAVVEVRAVPVEITPLPAAAEPVVAGGPDAG